MDTDAYLARLGLTRPPAASSVALRDLHVAHLERVSFENLDIALGTPLSLDPDALFDKIVTRRRGGFCYELNGLFALLLGELGYDVTLLAARVSPDGEWFGPPLDHLALRVRCADGTDWLADVGFGAHSREPVPWTMDVDHVDPDGTFRLEPRADGDVDVRKDGQVAYRLEPHPRRVADFVPMCWYQQTSPDSHFAQNVICSRSTPDGRVSLSGDRLIVTRGAERTERQLADDAAVLDAYRQEFGVELDRVPRRPG